MIRKFLKFIEIKTKITSLFAFLMIIAYLFYLREPVNIQLTAVFAIAMMLFDLTTTAINNYIDSKDYPEMLPIPRQAARISIFVMFLTGTALSLYLVYCTDIIVLLLGMLCVLCGVCYTYGPIPISRLPLGEICSGVIQGIIVPFILLYINMPAGTYLSAQLSPEHIAVSLKLMPIAAFLLLGAVPTFLTSNIMLANNTCDIEADVKVNRFTLPYFIGNRSALRLFAAQYYICYLSTVVMVICKFLHPVSLVFLLTFPIVQKNIRIFRTEQKKATTFGTAIMNYNIMMTAYIISITLSGIVIRL